MSVESAVAAGRRAAESRMTSRCKVRRLGSGTTTGDGGYQVPAWDDVLTESPLRISPPGPGGNSRTVRVGESEIEVAVRVAHFPATTTTLRDRDVIEVTSGDCAGLFLRVIEASWADQQTALRVPVVEEDQPEGWA